MDEREGEVDSIDLFLNSFGEGSGFGVYQLIEDVMFANAADDVVPRLNLAMQSKSKPVMYWCTQIAANFPDEQLHDGLKIALEDENVDIREAAITAIEAMGGNTARSFLKARLDREEEADVKVLIQDVLSSL